MEEKIFFNEGGITVTNSRFVVPGQTYTMSGVTSIKSVRHDPSKKWPIILLGIGIIMLLSGGDAAVPALLLIVAGVVWLYLIKPTYGVVLSSASGETEALTSKDGGYINRIVNALNDAIVSRG